MRYRRLILVMAVVVPVLFASTLPSETVANAAQGADSLTIDLATTYLGPEVVVSGSAGAGAGLPDVSVIIASSATPETPIFDGAATTALRPPIEAPSLSWRVPLSLDEGSYVVTAVSTLNGVLLLEQSGTFDVVNEIAVPVEVFPIDTVWSYYDAGDQPAPNPGDVPVAWYEPGYDTTLAAGWGEGPAELGYGDGDEATVTSDAGIFGQSILTQYFRHEFTPTGLDEIETLTLSLLRDDGAVVYLNGVELGRTNMPAGPITYNTFALAVSEQIIEIDVATEALLPGVNLLAVEVHQASFNSTDLSFSASMAAAATDDPKVSDATEGVYVLTAGDMARCNFDGDEAVAAQMQELLDTDGGLFLGLGDLVYNSGTIDEFNNCYDPTFGQFRDITWPSPGNHEHYTRPNAAGYREYFGPAAGPTAGPNGGLWYSFDVDDYWHVIALDSDCTELPASLSLNGDACAAGSPQEQWLRADLEANKDKNILAFFHHPPFTNNQYVDHQRTFPLWRALTEYGAELTLHGHEHHYERYTPLDYWGEPLATGTREFIIGSGGTFPRYDVRPAEAESEFRGTFPPGTNDFGVMQLWLRPDGYEWKWESIYGLAEADAGTSGLTPPMERAAITGVIRQQFSGELLADIEVCAESSRSQVETCVRTDEIGTYVIDALVSDSYQVSATDDDLSNGAHLDGSVDGIELVAPIGASSDLALVPLSSIVGSVTVETTGAAIAGATVCATPIDGGDDGDCATSDNTGAYEILDLAPQVYEVLFEAADSISRCYDDADAPCDPLTRTTVEILAEDITGIDAALPVGPGRITGQVTAQGGGPLSAVVVCADSVRVDEPVCDDTDAVGEFELEGLVSGNYVVSYDDPSDQYLPECYRNRPCDQPILVGVVQPATRANIDASLALNVQPGDVNCSGTINVTDALVVGQFSVGNRQGITTCPLTDIATQINSAVADVNNDSLINVTDALIIAQCSVAVPNVLCP